MKMEAGSGFLAIELYGELDEASVAAIRPRLLNAAGSVVGALIVDLAGVTCLDAQALELFTDMHRRVSACGGLFVVVNVSGHVGQPIRARGLDRLFSVNYLSPVTGRGVVAQPLRSGAA